VRALSGSKSAEVTEWDTVEGAIYEIAELERRASVDDSQSTLLFAIAERAKQRTRSQMSPQETADREREKIERRIRSVTASLEEKLRAKVNRIDEHNASSLDQNRTLVSDATRSTSSNLEPRFLPNSEAGAIGDVVFLVHGIHTHGQWYRTVRRIIENIPCQVVDIKFGYWDVISFLRPGTRKHPIARVAAEIRRAKVKYPKARLFAIAHSFGTYALMHASDDPTFEMTRVILCGSVVSENFVPDRYFLASEDVRILNDCGVRDIWPVLAKCTTWGYGATGTFGMGTSYARDRYFDFRHGDFFAPEFVTQYWLPFIRDGTIVPSSVADDAVPWPSFFSALGLPIWRWLIWGTLMIVTIMAAWSIVKVVHVSLVSG
jgi:hypothetical protein